MDFLNTVVPFGCCSTRAPMDTFRKQSKFALRNHATWTITDVCGNGVLAKAFDTDVRWGISKPIDRPEGNWNGYHLEASGLETGD